MKKIPLTQGKFAIVDDEDFEFLSQWNWYYLNGYAVRSFKGSKILMHRVINKTPDYLQTDHINRNRLDNRKINLRNATVSENQTNRLSLYNTTGYRGVFRGKGGAWRVRIQVKGEKINIGSFKSIKEAAIAYNKKALEIYGDFAVLNEI